MLPSNQPAGLLSAARLSSKHPTTGSKLPPTINHQTPTINHLPSTTFHQPSTTYHVTSPSTDQKPTTKVLPCSVCTLRSGCAVLARHPLEVDRRPLGHPLLPLGLVSQLAHSLMHLRHHAVPPRLKISLLLMKSSILVVKDLRGSPKGIRIRGVWRLIEHSVPPGSHRSGPARQSL